MTSGRRMAEDLGAVFDAHVKAEFVDQDVAATMATMSPEPYLTHVPTLAGGTGRNEVEHFYREYFCRSLAGRRRGQIRLTDSRNRPGRR